jgi:hypothetical protein
MPNLKIFVEEKVFVERKLPLFDALGPIRDMLCQQLNVDVSACQLAIMPVHGLDDQPPVNAELSILPKPERTKEVVVATCQKLQAILVETTGTKAAIRAATLDPATYVALK